MVLLPALILYLPLRYNYFCVDDFYNLIIAAETDSVGDLFRPVFQHLGPLLRLYFFALYRLFGLDYRAFFFSMLCVHLINTILVYILLRRIFATPSVIFAAPFYAWNPLFYEALNWQTNIGQMLCMALILLTLIFLTRYWQSGCRMKRWLVLSVFCCVLSMLAFSIGLLTPLFVLLYYYLVLKGSMRVDLRKDFKNLIGFFPAASAYLTCVFTRPHMGFGSFFSFKPLLLKYVAASVFCVLLPAFGGLGPFRIEAPPCFSLYLSCWLLLILVIALTLRKDLNWKILSFASLYLLMNYAVHGTARLQQFGEEIAYWLRYQIFQVFGALVIAVELSCAAARRFSARSSRSRIYLLIALQIFFLWRASAYIGTQNAIYRERYGYEAIKRYIGNVRRSYALTEGKLGEGEKIYLAGGETVPEYVMPQTLRPLNEQRHFLKIALPRGARISFNPRGHGQSQYRIDRSGVLIPTAIGNATPRSAR